MTQIPIYRARKLDSDEYIEGYLFIIWDKYYILWGTTNNIPNQIEINPSTLAIHFPNMIDKNGKKIFASLSKDGIGGDNLLNPLNEKCRCIYYDLRIVAIRLKDNGILAPETFNNGLVEGFEIIGIHKG